MEFALMCVVALLLISVSINVGLVRLVRQLKNEVCVDEKSNRND